MDTISFAYEGKTYTARIKVGLIKEPCFFCCYPNDAKLVSELGECILFIRNKGVYGTPHYYPPKYRTLLCSIEKAIKEYTGDGETLVKHCKGVTVSL